MGLWLAGSPLLHPPRLSSTIPCRGAQSLVRSTRRTGPAANVHLRDGEPDNARTILANGQYDVGRWQPAYLTVQDKTLNQACRRRFHYREDTYAMTVPPRRDTSTSRGRRARSLGEPKSRPCHNRGGCPDMSSMRP